LQQAESAGTVGDRPCYQTWPSTSTKGTAYTFSGHELLTLLSSTEAEALLGSGQPAKDMTPKVRIFVFVYFISFA